MGKNVYLEVLARQEQEFLKRNYLSLHQNHDCTGEIYYLAPTDKEAAQKEILARYVAV